MVSREFWMEVLGGRARYQHVETGVVGETSHESGDERIAGNGSKYISLIPYMLDLLKLDDCAT
jgi:hypothetical protein